MSKKILLANEAFNLTLKRLCQQVIENYHPFENIALIGIQSRGAFLAKRMQLIIEQMTQQKVTLGLLDVTFYRDDFRKTSGTIVPQATQIDFLLEDMKVLLIDDVLFTGRTVRAAMDALLDFGRPQKIDLLTLVDRRYLRDLPIQPNYVGITVDTTLNQNVHVSWLEIDGEDSIILNEQKSHE